MGGSLPQLIALNDVIVGDKFRNMAQMAVVVFALGAIILRSLVGGLFVVTPLFAVMLANFGLMGWLGTPLDISAMTTAAMAIGIGADYEIYLLFRFREELARTGSVLAATRNSMLTSGKAILLVAISIIARLRGAAGLGVRLLQHALEHGDGDHGDQRVLRAVLPARADDAVQAPVRLRRPARRLLQPGSRGDPEVPMSRERRAVARVPQSRSPSAAVPGGSSQPADPSARDIMEKNFFVTRCRRCKIESTMVLINDKGQRRERRSTGHHQAAAQRHRLEAGRRFNTPADIKGTSFLQVEHIDGDDDLWIYLPALKKSRRLVANNKKDSFVGSDFSYGDITLPKVDQYRHTLLRTEKVDGARLLRRRERCPPTTPCASTAATARS